mgnify:CR=1 FL=1
MSAPVRPTLDATPDDRPAPPFDPTVVDALLTQLDKTVRAVQQYPANNPVYRKSMELMRAAFAPVWAEAESLTLQVSDTAFIWFGVPVHVQEEKAGDSLPWTLYKDGLRELTITPGFEVQELDRFLAVIPRVRKALPLDDVDAYKIFASANTSAVFQFESRGMRDMLKQARPDRFEDIIALVALYRPGPMANIPTYCARKHGDEEPEYLHPMLEPILKETFGVIIYQEQVMQIAQVMAGYSLGEADLLRRAMGKKIRAEMEKQRAIFVAGATKNGVPKDAADTIFDLLAKFADYGFNKSHAAAYALVSYHTAYMKAHYPVEFLAASMTLEIHNTDKLSEFRAEAQRLGIKVEAPSVNRSGPTFEVADGTIFYALAGLKGVGHQAVEQIVEATLAEGVERAAKILTEAKYPITYGLSDTTCEAQRVAVSAQSELLGLWEPLGL